MDTKLLVLFIVLNIVNVVVQTIKSICTIKCDKVVAAIVNAIAYGLYTVVTIYMLCDLPLMWKAFIVAMCNLVGVYVVKLIEEKARKDKLWKVEATIHRENTCAISQFLKENNIPYNCFKTSGDCDIFNIFCKYQEESRLVKIVLDKHFAKYFVSESKTL